MADLKEILKQEIPEFRALAHQFVNKEIAKVEFKGQSGGMGVYAERDGQHMMIRLKMTSGTVTLEQLQNVLSLAKKYKCEKVHLTTREAIQLHGLSADDVCDIMEEALESAIYTRGGGGNFPRNVALSPLSGVEKGEAFDVTPYALIVNKYFMERMITYKLPRKFKVAFSNSDKDHACSTATDQGFMATIKDGKPYFRVYLAGGLGKDPAKGILLDEYIEPTDVLYHVEGMLNLFMAEGDYENKAKARTRYIPRRMGEEAFLACYKEHVEQVKKEKDLHLPIELTHPALLTKKGITLDLEDNRLIAQKQEGLYTVVIHPQNGQLSTKMLEELIEHLSKYEDLQLRLTMNESLYVQNLTGPEAEGLLKLIEGIGQVTDLERSVSCIGVPVCQMGIAQSQKLLSEILTYFKDRGMASKWLPSLHVSGCINSCGRHQVSNIGFVGKKKKVGETIEEVFEIFVGGRLGKEITVLGENYGDLCAKEIPEFLYELAELLEQRQLKFLDYLQDNENEFKMLLSKYLV
ncbi:ferredoxin--nitrite reductase [Sporanaerobium hydrogeniformans]|uniref:Ferredoxin--nitrite reductase n=1 Tax=Sporanaerobium hydrogeniformans TaxID=3072179 RepID=A0AC61DA03_9FIRM|nr:nitrite/sulfite reductase [Sporanaerobium hydrogeniformans]PHV70114.1 ferredoxin--nitrite reductase [Sporanaerobium hydrogeniformans]